MSGTTDEATACAYTDYENGEAPEGYPKTGEGTEGVEADVWEALYGVEDPEMPVSVVDLGLIYGVDVEEVDANRTGASGEDDANRADASGREHRSLRAVVEMTLTYSGCPAREMLRNDVRCAALSAGVDEVEVRLRYSPSWNVNMVTEAGREDLREFGLSV